MVVVDFKTDVDAIRSLPQCPINFTYDSERRTWKEARPRILVAEWHGHWTAWFEDWPEETFGRFDATVP